MNIGVHGPFSIMIFSAYMPFAFHSWSSQGKNTDMVCHSSPADLQFFRLYQEHALQLLHVTGHAQCTGCPTAGLWHLVPLCVCAKSFQLWLTLYNSLDFSQPGSSFHGILQARILEWIGMPSSRGSSQPMDQTHVSHLLHWQAGSLPLAPPGKPIRSHHFMANKWGKSRKSNILFSWNPKSLWRVTAATKIKDACFSEKL